MKSAILVAALALISVASAITKPDVPTPASPIPELQCTTTAQARRVFLPTPTSGKALPDAIGEGFASLPVTNDDGFVSLPINFKGTSHNRASWDIQVKLDLTQARGIEFELLIENATEVSSITLYFHSKDGWYSHPVSIPDDNSWEHIVINKAKCSTEDKPGGWADIDTIRLSFWRGGKTINTTAAVANFAVTCVKPDIAIIRADSCLKPGNPENKGYSSFAANVAGTCDSIGVEYVILSDLNTPNLDNIKIIILPYNPKIPENTFKAISDFVTVGGKLIVLYSLPAKIGDLLGLKSAQWCRAKDGFFTGFRATSKRLPGQPDLAPQNSPHTQIVTPVAKNAHVIANWAGKDGVDSGIPAVTISDTGAFIGHVWYGSSSPVKHQLAMALTGHLNPIFWQKAAKAAIGAVGNLGNKPCTSFDGFKAFFRLRGNSNDAAMAEFQKTLELHATAEQLYTKGKWQEAFTTAMSAADAARRAWCLCQKPSPAPEIRATWCHSAFGLPGKSWDESIKFLADNGFNTIIPNMCWGINSYYPSNVLVPHVSVAEKGDQVKQCLEACAKYGVKCHVWRVCWNSGGMATPDTIKKYKDAGRLQRSLSSQDGAWLCPSNPENQQLEIDAMLELVRNYPTLDGIHFDYIRYPGSDACFCDGCRKRFEKIIGHPLVHWPITNDEPALLAQWQQFRRDNITAVVRKVHAAAKKIRPSIQISAALFNNCESARDSNAQDWGLWCRNGWLDFFCPMNYTESNSTFSRLCKMQMRQAHGIPFYPGIGLSCWDDTTDPVKLALQIDIARKLGLKGFTVFNFDHAAIATFPFLKLGATSK